MSAQTSGKSLVVYYSLSGNTERVAREIARKSGADVEILWDLEREGELSWLGYAKAAIDALRGKAAALGGLIYDPRNYALVVIGTPVWAGHMTPAVRAYLQRFKANLPHVAFFVTSGNTSASKIAPQMETIVGHGLDASVGFNAADLADPRRFDEKLEAFMQAMRRSPVVSGSGVASAA